MKKLKTLFVDTEKGRVVVNGEVLENVTAFSVIFKDGEYGLQVTSDDIYIHRQQLAQKFFWSYYPIKYLIRAFPVRVRSHECFAMISLNFERNPLLSGALFSVSISM